MSCPKPTPSPSPAASEGVPAPGEWFTAATFGAYHYRVTFFRRAYCGVLATDKTYRLGSRESAADTRKLALCRKCVASSRMRA